jgi:3-oxoacyl-[acyl-carrier protein] reductase
MTKTLAKEWGRMRVNVNAVAYGFIRTRMTEVTADADTKINIEGREIKVGINPDLMKALETQIPLGRAGTPEDAAGAVYLFCVPESNYVSGQTLVCGGGFTLG